MSVPSTPSSVTEGGRVCVEPGQDLASASCLRVLGRTLELTPRFPPGQVGTAAPATRGSRDVEARQARPGEEKQVGPVL